MGRPKSVTKVKKNNGKPIVTFVDNVDFINYTIEELSAAALRDVGKVLKSLIKEATPVYTGLLKKSWQYWVRKDKTQATKTRLELGVYTAEQAKKKGQKYAHHAHLVLLGHTAPNGTFIEGNNFFYSQVQQNIGLIREIEGQYLSAINDENEALALLDAEESKGGDDE